MKAAEPGVWSRGLPMNKSSDKSNCSKYLTIVATNVKLAYNIQKLISKTTYIYIYIFSH